MTQNMQTIINSNTIQNNTINTQIQISNYLINKYNLVLNVEIQGKKHDFHLTFLITPCFVYIIVT